MKINYYKPACFDIEVAAGMSFLQASGSAGDMPNNPIDRQDDDEDIIL